MYNKNVDVYRLNITLALKHVGLLSGRPNIGLSHLSTAVYKH